MAKSEITTEELSERTGCPRGSIAYTAMKAGVSPLRTEKVKGKYTNIWPAAAVAAVNAIRSRMVVPVGDRKGNGST